MQFERRKTFCEKSDRGYIFLRSRIRRIIVLSGFPAAEFRMKCVDTAKLLNATEIPD